MKPVKLIAATVSAAALVTIAMSPAALGQTAAKAAAAAPEVDPFEQAMTADKVAEFARRQKDPGAMILAARLLQEIPVHGDQPAAGGAPAPFSPDAFYAEAKAMGALPTEITVAKASGRGVSSSMFGVGLLRVIKDVDPQATWVFPIKAKPGELLRVGAIGGSDTAMGMRLRDGKGKVVCADVGSNHSPVCSIQPGAATDYKVEVLNQGKVATKAVIISN